MYRAILLKTNHQR